METCAPSVDSRVGAASGQAFNPSYDEAEEGFRGSDDSLGAYTAGSRDAGPSRPARAPGVSFAKQEGGTVPSSREEEARFASRSRMEPGKAGKANLICGGFVSRTLPVEEQKKKRAHVCVVSPANCRHKHAIKHHGQLAPGWFVTDDKGDALFVNNFISQAAASCMGFADFCETALPLETMISFVASAVAGTFDGEESEEVAKCVCAGVERPSAPPTPCKRVKLAGMEEGEEGTERSRWTIAETAINDNARCMVGLEGHVGQRGKGEGPATLWEGVQAAETCLDGVEDWVGVTLFREVGKAKEKSLRSHSVDASTSRTFAQYLGTGAQASLPQLLKNPMNTQEVRLRDQSREISDLLATTRQQHSILAGIFDGSISIPQSAPAASGPLVGRPFVTQAVFDTHVADSAYARSLPSQGIIGGAGLQSTTGCSRSCRTQRSLYRAISLPASLATNVFLPLWGDFKT